MAEGSTAGNTGACSDKISWRSLCTYENPAALHLVDGWKAMMRMAGRLIRIDPAPERGVETVLVRRENGEVEEMTIISLPNVFATNAVERVTNVVFREVGLKAPVPCPFYKHIHFGIVPYSPMWDRLRNYVAEEGVDVPHGS